MYHIYEEQTIHRDELRKTSRERIADIVDQINGGVYENETVELMLKKLVEKLDGYTGKKVYGYLPKPAKNLINGIVDELAKDERIAALYDLWYNQRDAVFRIYQDNSFERIPLSQNKEFKSIRNTVLQEALKLSAKYNMVVKTKSNQNHIQKDVTSVSVSLAAVRLFARIAQILQDDISKNDDSHFYAEKKLQQKITEKKLAQGIKLE